MRWEPALRAAPRSAAGKQALEASRRLREAYGIALATIEMRAALRDALIIGAARQPGQRFDHDIRVLANVADAADRWAYRSSASPVWNPIALDRYLVPVTGEAVVRLLQGLCPEAAMAAIGRRLAQLGWALAPNPRGAMACVADVINEVQRAFHAAEEATRAAERARDPFYNLAGLYQ